VGILGPGLDSFPLEVAALLHRRISRLDVKHCGNFETYDVGVVVDYQVRSQHISEKDMVPAAARLRMVIAVAAEEVRHIPIAVAVVGYRISVAAVGCSIDLGLDWGRFANLEGMVAAVGCNTPSSLFVGCLVGFGHRMTVEGCSRRLCLVRAGCQLLDKTRLLLDPYILVYSDRLLVDRMKAALVLCIHLGSVRSHCSQSYFAMPVPISKV